MTPVTEAMVAEAAAVVEDIEHAHERCGQAHVRVMQLEDQRQALKPEVIKRLVETKVATSASAAEKLVEQDSEYMNHRHAQYDAEIERWRALGQVKVASIKAALAAAVLNA